MHSSLHNKGHDSQKNKLCLLQGLNWDKLRCFSSTGEASSPEDYHWLAAMAGYKPVIEYCGGTEIGGGFLGGTMVQPQAPSHFSTPTIGCRLALLDDQTVLYDSLQGVHTCAASHLAGFMLHMMLSSTTSMGSVASVFNVMFGSISCSS